MVSIWSLWSLHDFYIQFCKILKFSKGTLKFSKAKKRGLSSYMTSLYLSEWSFSNFTPVVYCKGILKNTLLLVLDQSMINTWLVLQFIVINSCRNQDLWTIEALHDWYMASLWSLYEDQMTSSWVHYDCCFLLLWLIFDQSMTSMWLALEWMNGHKFRQKAELEVYRSNAWLVSSPWGDSHEML
jgi:hypothetical protein